MGVKVKIFYVDGAGARPDGTGSAIAWVREQTGVQRVQQIDGLTNNQAEYEGVIAVLRYVVPGSNLLIYTDSLLVSEQFNNNWAVNDPELRDLLSQARQLIKRKNLQVEVRWIPREKNLAGKLLEHPARWSKTGATV